MDSSTTQAACLAAEPGRTTAALRPASAYFRASGEVAFHRSISWLGAALLALLLTVVVLGATSFAHQAAILTTGAAAVLACIAAAARFGVRVEQ